MSTRPNEINARWAADRAMQAAVEAETATSRLMRTLMGRVDALEQRVGALETKRVDPKTPDAGTAKTIPTGAKRKGTS